MNFIALISFLFSTQIFAQVSNIESLKSAMITRENSLEKIYEGMSKEIVTKGKIVLEDGECNYMQKSSQTVLKVKSDKVIIHAKNVFMPQATESCKNAGYSSFGESLLFTDSLPSVDDSIKALEASLQNIQSYDISGEIVTINQTVETEDENGNKTASSFVVKTDLGKPLFRNLILMQAEDYSVSTSEVSDKDVKSFNLSNILFCQNNDGDSSDCVMGNYSDILF